jgi:hypothetical protein
LNRQEPMRLNIIATRFPPRSDPTNSLQNIHAEIDAVAEFTATAAALMDPCQVCQTAPQGTVCEIRRFMS